MPSLSGNTALDVAIGLSFVYLLFSLLLSAVQEAIAAWLGLRAATLEKAIKNLLESKKAGPEGTKQLDGGPEPPPAATGALASEFYGHALIQGLYKSSWWRFIKGRTGPSYIPARTFATALLDILAPATEADDVVEKAKLKIGALPAGGTRQALLALVLQFGHDRDKLRTEIETWFDNSMGRASGWYKRQAQIILCLLAAGLTFGLNIDTITIGDRLARDDALRAAVVAQATAAVANGGPTGATGLAGANGTTGSEIAGGTTGTSGATGPTGQRLQSAADNVNGLKALGVPIGRSKDKKSPVYYTLKTTHDWVRKLGGWLLTFIALSLGAPFWFDALSKLSRLRATGVPEKPQDTAPTAGGGPPQEVVVRIEGPPEKEAEAETGPTRAAKDPATTKDDPQTT
ncbi:MAG: hypothetical protein QOE06_3158 [Thermoleophilaceae bacterium]|jgi:hypothetical protein|nr:hypothetical protein [Thermoleophilaceae bacterium]